MANENKEKLSDDLKAFEAALGSLQPAARPIDRDRLMFLAGQASASNSVERPAIDSPQVAKRRSWGWPLATAVSLLLSISLMGRVAYLSSALERLAANRPATTQQIALADIASAMNAKHEVRLSAEANYLALRNAVVNSGVDALPVSHNTGETVPAQRSESALGIFGGDFSGG